MNFVIFFKLRLIGTMRVSNEDRRDDEVKLLLLTTIITVYFVANVVVAVRHRGKKPIYSAEALTGTLSYAVYATSATKTASK